MVATTRRGVMKGAAGALITVLAFPAVTNAQVATPASLEIERNLLASITVFPDQLPDRLIKVRLDRHQVEPGFDMVFGRAHEGVRGRGFVIEAGELLIEPLVPSPLWRNASQEGTTPLVVAPGEQAHLQVGDAMYLPAVAANDIAEDAGIRVVNPGDETAVQVGFHLHQAGGSMPAVTGYQYTAGPEYGGVEVLAQIGAGATTFRLSRLTASPGALLTADDGTAVAMYLVDGGELTRTLDTVETSWSPTSTVGGIVDPHLDIRQQVQVTGGEPADVIELVVIPGEETPMATPAG